MTDRETTPMVMRLMHPVRDHLGKPVHEFHSTNAAWQMQGPFYIVLTQRNTPSGAVQDSHTIPALWCSISIYNLDVAKLAEENARKREAARQILETPDDAPPPEQMQ